MNDDDVIDGYLRAAARHGGVAEVRLRNEVHEELSVRSAALDATSAVRASTVAVRLWHGGGIGMAVAPRAADPAAVIADALDAACPTTVPPQPVRFSAGTGEHAGDRVPACPLSDLFGMAAELTADDSDDVRSDLWVNQTTRTVTVATTEGGRGAYRTCTASLLYRVRGIFGGAGRARRTHIDRSDFGADAEILLRRLNREGVQPCRAAVRAPALPERSVLPTQVVLDASVAAPLMVLFSRSLCADAVTQGRSRLTGRLGERVLSPWLSVVDDPLATGAPLHAPFDDEGTATTRRVLVDRGVLVGLLGSRDHAGAAPGAAAGNGWQLGPTVPPRPAPGNLWIESPDDPAEVVGPVLRVVQVYGTHLSNDITGDFSLGVTALVEEGDSTYAVEGLTVAGNVFDMLGTARPLACGLSWSGGSSSYCASPDLLVEGLTVGA